MTDNEEKSAERLALEELRYRFSVLEAENRALSSKLAAAEELAKVWEECCDSMRETLMVAIRRV